jgi:integrase
MPTARKLPSGNWRCRVYSHTDSTGKKVYESFTASTKTQAESMASKFANQVDRKRVSDLTVEEAVSEYIKVNENALSPSTIYNYKGYLKYYAPVSRLKIRKIDTNDMQLFISGLINQNLSPKSIKNIYGLLRTALYHFNVDTQFRVHLPQLEKKRLKAPENTQIMALYNEASPDMKKAIILAAFHSLRRGEICGLKYKDLDGNTLYVHSDMVKSTDGHTWVHKETPKTSVSNRIVYLTNEELQVIGQGDPEEYIVPLVPNSIGTNFDRLKKRTGVNIRFHDLRVYFASISAVMGIPEIVTAHHGGWTEGSKSLSEHYRRPIESIDLEYANQLNTYFDGILKQETGKT